MVQVAVPGGQRKLAPFDTSGSIWGALFSDRLSVIFLSLGDIHEIVTNYRDMQCQLMPYMP